MELARLSLSNFRNYARQELALSGGHVLLLGENAQGKTNLLEAIFLLVTGRSERADTDADLISWRARSDSQPVARVVGSAHRSGGPVAVEVLVAGRVSARGVLVASKRFKLNGVPRRASDVIGAITSVLFTTDDMELVRGAPSGRRRYLDVMLSQADRGYVRALQRYTKVVTQRNALLRRVQEGHARGEELEYWDGELAREGAQLLTARARAAVDLARGASEAHARLSGEREAFALAYRPRFSDSWPAARLVEAASAEVAAALLERLQQTRARDIAAGVTLTGPHRDDLTMLLGGEPASSFASRGQQRTAALALRLAEARLLFERSGERPILLLDDVLSELDASRRSMVLAEIDADQVLITSADRDRFSPGYLGEAQVWRVHNGVAERE